MSLPACSPWQSILEFKSVAGMGDCINVRIQAGHKFAGARWNHGDAGGQQTLISKGTNQSQHSVWRPRSDEQEANRDASFCDSNFHRCFLSVLIWPQTLHVHLLCLLLQRLLMVHNMRDNLAVVINNQGHGDDVGECENRADEHAVVKCVGQVIEGAWGEISFWYVTSPKLKRRHKRPWKSVCDQLNYFDY